MKFGKTLQRITIPEWSRYYIAYKALKQQIKQVQLTQKKKGSQDKATEDVVTAFFFTLDRELEKVNAFFQYKHTELERRLVIYGDRFRFLASGVTSNDTFHSDVDSDAQFLVALEETKEQLGKILRFVDVNRLGFRKILKKFDKKTRRETLQTYTETKVTVLPFATSPTFNEMLEGLAPILLFIQFRVKENELMHSSDLEAAPKRTRTFMNLTDAEVQHLMKAIKEDDDRALTKALDSLPPHIASSQSLKTRLLSYLLARSCFQNSRKCLPYLISSGATLSSMDDINQRTLLHKLVISGGILTDLKSIPRIINSPSPTSPTLPCYPSVDNPVLISFLLERLEEIAPDHLKTVLFGRDIFGRKPIHYAAIQGSQEIARTLLQSMRKHCTLDGCANANWLDHDGFSPFFYAVLKGHAGVLQVLIEEGEVKDVEYIASASEHQATPTVAFTPVPVISPVSAKSFMYSTPHSPLGIASKYGHSGVVALLLKYGSRVNAADDDGETALHYSCRGGFAECVKLILDIGGKGVEVDAREKGCGWTPLHVASVEGHVECCRLLIEAGADPSIIDSSGWNSHEHAVFRAHVQVAQFLRPSIGAYPVKPVADDTDSTILIHKSPKNRRQSRENSFPDRAYGHKFLQNESMIVIRLGTTDIRKPVEPVELNEKALQGPITSSSFSLVVSAVNAKGEPAIIDLPLRESVIEPISFNTSDIHSAVMRFDIIPTFGTKKQLIGRATAMLSTTKTPLWNERVSLGGSVTVPIIGNGTMEPIGTVTFEYIVVNPFVHRNLKVGVRDTYWKSVETTVIGHRGSGANRVVQGMANLQLGENTVLSFVTAASLGAEYVEFDVQLTKDHVPVLYHDWTVTESGFDIPVNSVSLQQFLGLHPVDSPAGWLDQTAPGIARSRENSHRRVKSGSPLGPGKLNRSNSMMIFGRRKRVDEWDEDETAAMGVKGNSVGTIQAPFATLEETLKKVPTHIGFNVEIKYPNLEEAEKDDLHPADLNFFVDKILECVFEHAGDRNILFSSFHPEVCLMVNMKQCNYPVFFLTEAGTLVTPDIRCNSLQEAVRFAKGADVLGIVSDSKPLLESPNLIKRIKETGLLLFTYGSMNNDVQNAQLQKEYGVDAVIVDSVAKVRKGLYEQEL